jgi:hypothetical protein
LLAPGSQCARVIAVAVELASIVYRWVRTDTRAAPFCPRRLPAALLIVLA